MSRRFKLCLASLVLIAVIAWFGRGVWLSFLGQYLVGTKGESKSGADVVVVPAADYIRADVNTGTLEHAATLLREGRVRQILMSCAEAYGVSECELAEKALRDRGYPQTRIEWLRTERLPDEVEADLAIRHLKDSGNKSAIILLPNYKARRLGQLYRRLGAQDGIEVAVWRQAGAFDPQRWWKSREGQKRFVEELMRLTRLL
jgi:hypothetical protein